MDLLTTLDDFFSRRAPLAAGEEVLVAFSGGPDSTALLAGLAELAPRRGFTVAAAHLDHGLDPGSAGRAEAAAALARRLGVPLTAERREIDHQDCRGDSPEAAARRLRYRFLEEVRQRRGCRWVATAHHRDDQAETVLLRLLHGSGLYGLAGIRPLAGSVARPLLGWPRSGLAAEVARRGLTPVADPTNRDPQAAARNRLRATLLPRWTAAEPRLAARLAHLADAAGGARRRLAAELEELLDPRPVAGGVGVELERLRRLPAELLPFALALLHRRAGAPYPAPGGARAELGRQLALQPAGGRIGCDCGGPWRWQSRGELFTLVRRPTRPPFFTYTLEVPGEIEIPELGLRFRLTRGETAPWMFRGSPARAGLALPLAPGDRVTVRNRRPGDRLHPLGAAGSRRLKEVLIDRQVPAAERDRLPLLVIGGRIAWVPGVTIDERYRLRGGRGVWVAEIETP